MSDSVTTVRAAGCVLVRTAISDSGEATTEVGLVHRPRYDDWSHPKGKLDPGETDLVCAVREVAEETGLRGTIESQLDAAHYTDHKGRPKTVRYFLMRVVGGEFAANEEVDELRWLAPSDALSLLSYSHDEFLLDSLM